MKYTYPITSRDISFDSVEAHHMLLPRKKGGWFGCKSANNMFAVKDPKSNFVVEVLDMSDLEIEPTA